MKKKIITFVTILTLAFVVFASSACSKENADEPAETEAANIGTTTDEPESYGTVKLGKYKGLMVAKPSTVVEDREIDTYIEDLLANSGELEEVDRAAQEGDTVNIDFVGTKGGKAFDGGTANGFNLTLGSDSFIDGFEDGLIGTKKGDEKVLHLTFPENYGSEELAGQAVEFAVTVNAVQEQKAPELSDAWVSEYTAGEQTTVDAFRKELRSQFEQARIQNAKSTVEQQLAELAAGNAKFDIAPDALKYQEDALWSMYEQYAQAYGMSIDDYFAMYGTTADEAKADLVEYANQLCEQRLLVDEIYEKEKLSITEEAKNEVAALYATTYDELVEAYGKEAVEMTCKQQVVYDFLYDNAIIK